MTKRIAPPWAPAVISGGATASFVYDADAGAHGERVSGSVFVNQAGTTVATNYYYPYGSNRGGTAFSGLSTKRFTGQYHESSLPGGEGLSYYNARWYDAQLGRFLSADTLVPGPANP